MAPREFCLFPAREGLEKKNFPQQPRDEPKSGAHVYGQDVTDAERGREVRVLLQDCFMGN